MDDVTSGTTEADYHIKWEASEGTFVNPYGTNVTYLAPDYVEGPLIREITISATMDDFNRGTDVLGFNDAALAVQKGGKVWQVKLTLHQGPDPDEVSNNYDGRDVPEDRGGGQLGFIEHGDPAGSTGFRGATEILGEVAPEAPVAGYEWTQQWKGVVSHRVHNIPTDIPDDKYNSPNTWVWDEPIKPGSVYEFADGDRRSPNGADGADVKEIFLIDTPGRVTGVNNDSRIDDGWSNYSYDMDFKTWVVHGGNRVSKHLLWQCDFDLKVDNGRWVPDGDHTP